MSHFLAVLSSIGILAIPFLILLPLVLLARISHWTHHTQQKLDTTNKLLRTILKKIPSKEN